MNGELAQPIAIVMWGNDVLAGHTPATALDGHPVSQYVSSFAIDPIPRRWRRSKEQFASIAAWFSHLADTDVERLELDATGQPVSANAPTLAGHLGAAFVNSVPTPILAHDARSTHVFGMTYQLCDGPRPPDNRIWDVRISHVATIDRTNLAHPSIDDASRTLGEALSRIGTFAADNDTGHWIGWFQAAAHLLYDPHPMTEYWASLAPARALGTNQLLAATVKAWVFGGMGSWNDLGFEDTTVHAEYERLSRELYSAVLAGVDASG